MYMQLGSINIASNTFSFLWIAGSKTASKLLVSSMSLNKCRSILPFKRQNLDEFFFLIIISRNYYRSKRNICLGQSDRRSLKLLIPIIFLILLINKGKYCSVIRLLCLEHNFCMELSTGALNITNWINLVIL